MLVVKGPARWQPPTSSQQVVHSFNVTAPECKAPSPNIPKNSFPKVIQSNRDNSKMYPIVNAWISSNFGGLGLKNKTLTKKWKRAKIS